MTRTTLDTMTNQQIRNLRTEASNHNDDAMVTICNAALGETDDVADIRAAMSARESGVVLPTVARIEDWQAACRVRVVEAINAAEDMDDDDPARERTAEDIEALTPDCAWDIYVGSQSPAEFMGDADDAYAMAVEYVYSAEACAGLDDAARDVLASKLAAHIERA